MKIFQILGRPSQEEADLIRQINLAAYVKEFQSDPVNHPAHYTDGRIEVSDFIADKNLNFFLGNVVKYVSRAGKKDPNALIEDLRKAAWYLQREIERQEDVAR